MGWQVGTMCFGDGAAAMQAFCGAYGGVTSAGYVQCTGLTYGSAFANDQGGFYFNQQTISPSGVQSSQSGLFTILVPCDSSAWGNSGLLSLTPEQGGLISAAILLVWAVAWGIRQLSAAISDDGVSLSSND